jgi:hypothetical protein
VMRRVELDRAPFALLVALDAVPAADRLAQRAQTVRRRLNCKFSKELRRRHILRRASRSQPPQLRSKTA